VFGIKFRPGTFFGFLGYPVSDITDRVLDLADTFGVDGTSLRHAILAGADDNDRVEVAEKFLRARLPEHDPLVERVRDVVERIAIDRELTRVEHVASMMSLSLRPLQRTFRKYVGVTPKWVIQRYRLHEAAEQLAEYSRADLTDLALRLGYFDQAHFARDFKRVVGRSPGKYARDSATKE
jgi:AraC-like DNA-binding protein